VIRVGSLFSGIEGFGLGFERAGARVCWQVEIDKDCQRVQARHWDSPREPGELVGGESDGSRPTGWGQQELPVRHADVRAVGRHNLATVDLVCGGFPCQDLSVAGNRAGLAGERSGLWHEFHRILAELRPRWVVVENVPGLLSSDGGRDMGVVLRGLAELGYGWAYRVLDAQYFGVAQRRRRVFIVGCLGDAARAVQVLFEPESCDGDSPPSRKARQDLAGTLGGGSGERGWAPDTDRMTFLPEVAGTLSQGAHPGSYNGQDAYDDKFIAHALTSDGSDASEDGTGRGTPLVVAETLRSHPRPGSNSLGSVAPVLGGGNYGQGNLHEGVPMMVPAGSAVRRLTPTECERLQGFPDGWTSGLSDSARYRMLGNAVCVPVAEWIGRRIVHITERDVNHSGA